MGSTRRGVGAVLVLASALASACQLDERTLSLRDSGAAGGGVPPTPLVGDASAEDPADASSPDSAEADGPTAAEGDGADLAPIDASSGDAVDDAPPDGGDGASCSPTITAIAAALDGTCALRRDGRVACWGATAESQSAGPVLVPGLTGITAIALGGGNPVCALRSDGSVWCWGDNSAGELGDGTTASSSTPVRVSSLEGVKAIAAGASEACAIDADGAVWCWGDNGAGQLGSGFPGSQSCPPGSHVCSTVPVRVSHLTHAKAVALGEGHACAVRTDGAVWCWGRNYGELGNGATGPLMCNPEVQIPCSPVPVQVSGLTDVTAVAAGGAHTCALRSNGEVWCWGDDLNGQLGDGTFTDGFVSSPVRVSDLTDATAISASDYNSCAVRSTGAVVCWGFAFARSLGGAAGPETCGGVDCFKTPVAVAGVTGATSVTLGEAHACALRTDGTVVCWGNRESGQLGTGSLTGPGTCTPGDPSPCGVPVPIAPAIARPETCGAAADAGVGGACTPGETRCASNASLETCQVACDGCPAFVTSTCAPGLVCERATPAACGDPTLTDASSLDAGEASCSWRFVSAGGDGSCGILRDGRVACWGSSAGESATPVLVPDLTDTVAVTGVGFTSPCALRSDGTVWCWGAVVPVAPGSTPPVRVPNLADVTAIAGTCAIDAFGAVWCWGDNTYGQLGDGTMTPARIPVRVLGLAHAKALAAGLAHVCALLTEGSVWCWGANDGELGTGTTGPRICNPDARTPCSPVPLRVSGLTEVTAISAAELNTCALRSDGSVWCWGLDDAGQLGTGTFANEIVSPVQVSGLTDATAIAAGYLRTCAVRANGTVLCWGDNFGGALGIGTSQGPQRCAGYQCSPTPLAVKDLTGAVSVSVAESHVCALLASGTIMCWGANDSGLLGAGSGTGLETCDNGVGNSFSCSTVPVTVTPPGCGARD